MRRALFFALFAALLLPLLPFGCDNVKPTLDSTPTPSASPTPLPEPFTAEITAKPVTTDLLGGEVLSEDHYWQYLSFGELRVYEYGDGTFLDGVCVNAFPMPLDGQVDIVYYTESGKVQGIGTIHNAEGGTLLATGSNAVYAEISTDIDVQSLDFTLEVKRAFQPVESDDAG